MKRSIGGVLDCSMLSKLAHADSSPETIITVRTADGNVLTARQSEIVRGLAGEGIEPAEIAEMCGLSMDEVHRLIESRSK